MSITAYWHKFEWINELGNQMVLTHPWLLLEAVGTAMVIRLLFVPGLLELLLQSMYPVVVARRQPVAMRVERKEEKDSHTSSSVQALMASAA